MITMDTYRKSAKYRVLCVGVGNILRSDDGIGVYVARTLRAKDWSKEVLILEAGASILSYMEEVGTALDVIVVDAIAAHGKPGDIYRIDVQKSPPIDTLCLDSHGFSIVDALQLSREMTGLPRRAIIYGVQVQDLDFGEHLSPSVKAALPRLVQMVTLQIQDSLIYWTRPL